jgi:hypothetical protein
MRLQNDLSSNTNFIFVSKCPTCPDRKELCDLVLDIDGTTFLCSMSFMIDWCVTHLLLIEMVLTQLHASEWDVRLKLPVKELGIFCTVVNSIFSLFHLGLAP